jgi:DNA-binding NtrC family response regulator
MRTQILIVDDQIDMRQVLRYALTREGYSVTTVPTIEQAADLIERQSFDLVILDVFFNRQTDGLSLLEALREKQARMPVLIYSAFLTAKLKEEALQKGAVEALSKEDDIRDLLQRIRRILGSKDRLLRNTPDLKDKVILVVDDEAGVRDMLAQYFGPRVRKVVQAATGEEALKLVRSENPVAVLLDIHMPGMNGLETLEKIRAMKPHLPIFIMTVDTDDAKVKDALKKNASGYLLKPLDFLYIELLITSISYMGDPS